MTVAQEIDALRGLAIADLRKLWQDTEHRPLNRRWGRDVLFRGRCHVNWAGSWVPPQAKGKCKHGFVKNLCPDSLRPQPI